MSCESQGPDEQAGARLVSINARLGRVAITPELKRRAERVGFALYALVAAYAVGAQLTGTIGRTALPASPTAASAEPSASTVPFSVPVVSPSVSPALTPTSPPPTPAPVLVAAYQNAGRRFAALTVPLGHTLTTPISGSASVVLYQFLGGQIRVGSNVPTEPFFPYITITSDDQRVILRPGALGRDVQLIVKDGQSVTSGGPLFTVVGVGPSSWRTFYDPAVAAQVIASVTNRSTGAEVDPVPFFMR